MKNWQRYVLTFGMSAVMMFTGGGMYFPGVGNVDNVDHVEAAATQKGTKVPAQTIMNKEAEVKESSNGGSSGDSEDSNSSGSSESGASGSGSSGDNSSGDSSSGSSSSEGSTSNSSSNTGSESSTSGSGSASSGESGSTGTTGNGTANSSGSSSTTGSTETGNTTESTQVDSGKTTISDEGDSSGKKGTVKDIKNQLASKEESAEGNGTGRAIIPKIYNDTRLSMKNNKEYIAGYVYFNQGDSAWNQNGYSIASAGCGPTSMAVVITTLTGKWVTPLDTAIWGYQHGFYSSAGSVHAMIPAMAAAYGLNCEGVGTNYQKIKTALQQGHPVVCLMGPGYFTRGGHFMVLVAIDENDNVTVADVASRNRSAYKYKLSDVISQSKSASAGGPFWIMSLPDEVAGQNAQEKVMTLKDYTVDAITEDFAGTSYLNLKGNVKKSVKDSQVTKATVKKMISILTPDDSSTKTLISTESMFRAMTRKNVEIREDTGSSDTGKGSASDLALNIKRDIAHRQWDEKIDQKKAEDYIKGVLE